MFVLFFFFTHFSDRVAGEAVTSLDQPTQTAFRLDEVPNGSNQDPRCNQAILFVVFQLASFHSLQHIKFALEAIREAFCLHGQTIEAEIFRSGEVATGCRDIHELQCYNLCQT